MIPSFISSTTVLLNPSRIQFVSCSIHHLPAFCSNERRKLPEYGSTLARRLINTAIRNEHGSFEELCAVYELEGEALINKLSCAGYDFFPQQQQFR